MPLRNWNAAKEHSCRIAIILWYHFLNTRQREKVAMREMSRDPSSMLKMILFRFQSMKHRDKISRSHSFLRSFYLVLQTVLRQEAIRVHDGQGRSYCCVCWVAIKWVIFCSYSLAMMTSCQEISHETELLTTKMSFISRL